MKQFFTSESVSPGHPDKMCDQIVDSLLDEFLRQDPNSRVALEALITTGQLHIAGEVTTKAYVDINKICRETVREIGYTRAKYGFDADTCGILISLDEQSPDIAMGVDKSVEAKEGDIQEEMLGSGDQGLMFGYASNETEELMPLPITLANKLIHKIVDLRKKGTLTYLRPDAKSQVTVEYNDGVPTRIDAVVISTQHDPDVSLERLREDILNVCIKQTLPSNLLDENTKYYINPTGRFVIGGPQGDAGVVSRKLAVDTYGGMARHGGGGMSGKDPSKVDRSAAYAARYAAKNIVAAGLADRCEIQLAYAIGVAQPVSILVDTQGTAKISEEKIVEAVKQVFDFSPSGIIKTLNLRTPIYKQTAAFGHFGRTDVDLPWEHTDKVEALKAALGF